MIKRRAAQTVERLDAQLNKVLVGEPSFEEAPYGLFITTGATQVSATKYIWEYSVIPAILNPTTYVVEAKSHTQNARAFSVSELGNTTTVVAYGITLANLPAGFTPVPIPNGSAVFCVPKLDKDGQFYYLIINTQAIDGSCT